MNEWQKLVKIVESDKVKRKEAVRVLGYKNISGGVNKFINQVKNMTITEDKLKVIAPIFDIDTEELVSDYHGTIKSREKEQNFLRQISDLKEQISQRDNFKPHLYIEANLFTMWRFAQVCEKMKYIYDLPEDILELSKADQINVVKDFILKHYKENADKLPFFKYITGYTYYNKYNSGIKFSTSGEIIGDNILK